MLRPATLALGRRRRVPAPLCLPAAAPSVLGLSRRCWLSSGATGVGGGWDKDRVRRTFVEFFQHKHAHEHIPSSSLVPHNDPSLLFTNAGMNQFKPVFLGVTPPELAHVTRAVNAQRCMRAGGKHNDLEDVGKDGYHHTLFEMLGSWSFGGYGKAEAIAWAWDLLTQRYGLPAERLYVTYFAGDEAMSLPPDEEARQLWLQFVPESRVLPGSRKDNFWEMGDTGPCGPCSEIHFDHVGGRDAASLVNMDDPTVVELWNIVFISFNRQDATTLHRLPLQYVDTGMGLERLVAVLQGKLDNYDTDVFTGLERVADPYITERAHPNFKEHLRVVLDHSRALTFAIGDGVYPNNDGRGYVVRRIARRAFRSWSQLCPQNPTLFHLLCRQVVHEFGDAYPSLARALPEIVRAVELEQGMFERTRERGEVYFGGLIANGERHVTGEAAFFMHESLGFPLDLTCRMASERGVSVDVEGFERLLEAQRALSRQQRLTNPSLRANLVINQQSLSESEALLPPTNDGLKYEWYRSFAARVVGVVRGDGVMVAVEGADVVVEPGVVFGVVLDRTPFYSEAGGQVGDQGKLTLPDGTTILVADTQDLGKLRMHTCSVQHAPATLTVGGGVQCNVDYERRMDVAANHTTTHALNLALNAVLGGTMQQGSLVNAEKLRFDFRCAEPLTPAQLERVEDMVNAIIDRGHTVHTGEAPLSSATQISGLRTMAGVDYGSHVRVVSLGVPVPAALEDPLNDAWQSESIELCGGTHLHNTREAERFVIVEEGSVGSGVRRIVGVTRHHAAAAMSDLTTLHALIAACEANDDSQLEGAAKTLRDSLNSLSIPLRNKPALEQRIAAIHKRASAWAKARQSGAVDGVGSAVVSALRDAAGGGGSSSSGGGGRAVAVCAVEVNDAPLDKKLVLGVAKLVQGSDLSSPSFAVLHSGGAAMCVAVVPEASKGALQAGVWMRRVMGETEGQGGGGDAMAMGTIAALQASPDHVATTARTVALALLSEAK